MEKVKFYKLCFLFSGILLTSCKLYRETKEHEQKATRNIERYKERSILFQQTQRDSLRMFWHFWTDSLFSFHPDSGLQAQGGQIYVQQSKTTMTDEKIKAKEKKTLVMKRSDTLRKEYRKSISFEIFAAGIALLACLYLVWRVWSR